MDLNSVAKVIILVGALVMAMGLLFLFIDKIPWLGKLPGDIYLQRKKFNFYFPITTCIIISVMLSVVLYFILRK
jgi:uncharacterized protein HemY